MDICQRLIGCDIDTAKNILAQNDITDYTVIIFADRKQHYHDKEIVARAILVGTTYQLVLCPMQCAVVT